MSRLQLRVRCRCPRPAQSYWTSVKIAIALIGCVAGWSGSFAADTGPFSTPSDEHLEFHWAPAYEELAEPFEISPTVTITPGSYAFNQYRFQTDTSAGGAWRAGLQLQLGSFYDGRLVQAKPYVDWSSSDGKLNVRLDNETDWVRLPEGYFVQRLRQLRVTYALSPELALSGFAQHQSSSGHTGINAQLRWILSPGRELYAVLNHDVPVSVTDPAACRLPPANELQVKLHWDIQI